MPNPIPKVEISRSLLASIESRWEKARKFFQKKKKVVFASDRYRFWERHGFVQQSLAHNLLQIGVEVIWLDGANWRPYEPIVAEPHEELTVKRLFRVPGRRLDLIDRLGVHLEVAQIQRAAKGGALTWVQAGLDERVVEKLGGVDVFSVFDDMYAHLPGSPLCDRAKLVLCQNGFAEEYFKKALPLKTVRSLPPMELDPNVFEDWDARALLPKHFPKKIMGYIGAFKPDGFDMALLEYLIKECPTWGFLLAGRTDSDGEVVLNHLKQYPNFCHLDWVPRKQVGSLWKLLDVNLMLYRPIRVNAGAFPVKALEALYFGIPSIATRVPKTSSLEGAVPRTSFPDEIKRLAERSDWAQSDLQEKFELLYYEMHPKIHLAKVAERLG